MSFVHRTGIALPLHKLRQVRKDFGTCLNFSSGGIVKFGTGNPFSDSTNGFYVLMWVKWFGLNGAYQHLLSKRDSYGATTMMFDLFAKDTNGNVGLDTGGGTKDFANTLPLGRWVPIVYVHNPDPVLREQLYIDCELVSDQAVTGQGTGTTALLSVGACEAGAIEPFNGMIDEVVIGQTAPSWIEVIDMCKRYSYKNVFSYFKFDEGTGSTVADSSGNGHDGTLTGATWSSNVAIK